MSTFGLPPSPLRVFLVDDHELIRHGLTFLLHDEPGFEVAGEASTTREALALIPEVRPDVVVLDVRLPDGNGIDVCTELHSRLPDTRWLFLTAYDDEEALLAATSAGASGYLYKHTFGDELIDALRTVGRGGSLIDPTRTKQVLARLRSAAEEHERQSGSRRHGTGS